MKYFLDTEFYEFVDELGRGVIWPISIGIVADDDRCYYAEFADFDWSAADDWLTQNVLPHMIGQPLSRRVIAQQIQAFVVADNEPEFWAYVGSYDWVVLMQIFGKLTNRPANWPNRFHELKDAIDHAGLTKHDLPTQTGLLHRAIDDAYWNREAYRFVMG